MLVKSRHTRLLELVNSRGEVKVRTLSEELGVSEATIRRDLALFAQDGLLKRVHGGAASCVRPRKEAPVISRRWDNAEEKARIGVAAANLVKEGDTIFLGSGSTTVEVARALKQRDDIKKITVITNSIPIVNHLLERDEFEIILVGGYVRHDEQSAIGWIAQQTFRDLRADKVIIGISAVSVENGLLSTHVVEVITDRAILEIGSEIILVADHTKFGREETVRLAPITVVDKIVTDDKVSPHILNSIRALGIEIVIA